MGWAPGCGGVTVTLGKCEAACSRVRSTAPHSEHTLPFRTGSRWLPVCQSCPYPRAAPSVRGREQSRGVQTRVRTEAPEAPEGSLAWVSGPLPGLLLQRRAVGPRAGALLLRPPVVLLPAAAAL